MNRRCVIYMKNRDHARTRKVGIRKAVIAEFAGTAILISVGLSIVIAFFGDGSPLPALLPDPGIRRLMTGFLFGTTGALIAVSWCGKTSGAHINPAVTFSFWTLKKMTGPLALGYILAQFSGALLGALPLLFWDGIGRSVNFGATIPGAEFGPKMALFGEIITTFALIMGLFLFIGYRRLAKWTPLLFPFLYAVMVYWEAPISGTSTNPARTFGPAVISGAWTGWWIYFAGPLLGAGLAIMIKEIGFLKRLEIRIAKIYHFNHDPHQIFIKREEIPAGKT
ncbi:Permease, glycerol uptake facilitator [Candidatus Zixiibacteriota bacterium]|nr:Permease, glycerol uptake facilitator [candidate division Zixibacteria bacterium]